MRRKYNVYTCSLVVCIKLRCFNGNPYYAQLSRWTLKNLLSHARTIRLIPTNLVKKYLWAKADSNEEGHVLFEGT